VPRDVASKLGREHFAVAIHYPRNRLTGVYGAEGILLHPGGRAEARGAWEHVVFRFVGNHKSAKTELYPLVELATRGFAISLVTSASVALDDCFFVFGLPIHPIISRARAFCWSLSSGPHRHPCTNYGHRRSTGRTELRNRITL
jgi:hypothetical protein